MAEMKLDGGNKRQRGMLLPVIIALVLLIAAGAWFAKVYLHPAVTASGGAVQVFPVHTEFKRGTGMLVGENQTEDAIYVIADITLNDKGETPLFLKDINGSLTMEDGTVMTAVAMEKADLPRLAQMFPAMQDKVELTATQPLLRENSIAPGTSGHGYVIFAYNVPQKVWDTRKAADVTVSFYHHDDVKVKLAK